LVSNLEFGIEGLLLQGKHQRQSLVSRKNKGNSGDPESLFEVAKDKIFNEPP